MVMEKPSPPCVGREFVKQYYTMLNQAPGFLHRFYSHDSSFLHSGVSQQLDDDQQVVIGQTEIHKKIAQLGFRDCHAKIHQVDSQATVGDGVVIQVVGELSNDGGALRRFVQTFVLAAQSAKKYYVHNDIFRYQDEVFRDSSDGAHNAVLFVEQQGHETIEALKDVTAPHGAGCNGNVIPIEQQMTTPVVPVSHYETVITEQSTNLSNGVNHTLDELEVGSAAEHPPMREFNDEPSSADVESSAADVEHVIAISNTEVTVEKLSELQEEPTVVATEHKAQEDVESEKELETDSAEKTSELEAEPELESAKAPKPMTWAAMASKSPAAGGTQQPTAARTVRQQQASTRQDQKVDSGPLSSVGGANSGATSQPQRTSHRYSMGGGGTSQTDAAATVDHESSRGSVDVGAGGGPMTVSQQIYPDSQQVFVGNLPQYLTDKELREFFEQYGSIIEMKINRKSINVNNLPNFGFIVFDSTETVQKILSSRPLYLVGVNGRHRINVEEKKSRTELSASRPRSATRGGIRMPGYGRGADSYNHRSGNAAGRPNNPGYVASAASPVSSSSSGNPPSDAVRNPAGGSDNGHGGGGGDTGH